MSYMGKGMGRAEKRFLKDRQRRAAKESVEATRRTDKPYLKIDEGGVYSCLVFEVNGQLYAIDDDYMKRTQRGFSRLKDLSIKHSPDGLITRIRDMPAAVYDINHLIGDDSESDEKSLVIPAAYFIEEIKNKEKVRKMMGPFALITHDLKGVYDFQPVDVVSADNFPEYEPEVFVPDIATNPEVGGVKIVDLDALLRMHFDPGYEHFNPNYRPKQREQLVGGDADLDVKF